MDKTCNTLKTEVDKEEGECQQSYKLSKPLNKKDTKVETDTSEGGGNRNRHGKPSVIHLLFNEIPYLAHQLVLYPSEYEAISMFLTNIFIRCGKFYYAEQCWSRRHETLAGYQR